MRPVQRKGLERFKLDLHVHTRASHDWQGGQVDASAVVKEAIDKGLDAIAVTDHGTGQWIDNVCNAAKGTALKVFPGVELNNLAGNEGIHLVVLFPLETTSADVDRFLTKIGAVSGTGKNLTRSAPTAGPLDVLDAVLEFDAIAVLPHCASTKGALGDMRGELRKRIVCHQAVLAVETTAEDFYDAAKAAKRKRIYDLLDGSDPGYKRQLAVYQASDNPVVGAHGHDLSGIGGRFSYFYAESPLTLESLRQCFVDRDVRIEIPPLTEEARPARGAQVTGVSVTGGFLDGLDLRLHSSLTTILGAKGTGKSLLIEFLRFALDQEPTSEEIRRDHDHKLQSKLGLHSRVHVQVQTRDGGVITFEREYNPEAGNPFYDLSLLPGDVLRVHFLSQGEVIRVAESEEEQIRFIDSFFDFEKYQATMDEVTDELSQLDSEVARQIRARKQRDAEQAKIKELKAKIKEIDKKLKNPVFARQRKLEAKTRVITAAQGYFDELASGLQEAYRRIELLPVPPSPDPDVAVDPQIKRIEETRAKAQGEALTAIASAIDKVAEFRTAIDEEQRDWATQSAVEANTVSQEIRKQGGDLALLNQQRAHLAGEKATAETKLAGAQQTADLLTPTVKRRDELLEALTTAQKEYTAARQARCEWFEKKSEGQIRASVAAGANRAQFQERLRAMKRGSYLTDADARTIASTVEPNTFVRMLLRFDLSQRPEALEPIVESSGLPAERIRALADFLLSEENGPGYEALLRLQYATPPSDRPTIRFRTADGDYSPLEDLSTGQKCTALLVMTLCEGDRPIIIDQPEDSLDIRSIWDDMCLRLRRGKRNRQFVFTTHNSSLAVASDSDMFVVLHASAKHGEVVLNGAIDSQDVRDEVITLLEGGEPTYFLKQRKYNISDPYQRRPAPSP
jgi:PHP family Zn ribbon phosphoesterase